MSRTKSSLAHSVTVADAPVAAPDAPAPAPVKLTTDLSQAAAMPSPALDLQDNLRQAWSAPQTDASTTEERRIPIGWALTAVLVGCGAFWACLALVIF
jgi:hypothetical protein